MPCKVCGSMMVVRMPKPGGVPQQFYNKSIHESTGVWVKEMLDTDLCSYHLRKEEGWFDKSDEYWHTQGPRPHEFVKYESYWTQGGHFISARPVRGKSRSTSEE